MAQATTNNNKLSVQDMIDASAPVTKNGDWVLPVLDDNGKQLLVSQINKTQAEKDDFATIFAEYQNAGVKVHYYLGKNNAPVFAVEQGKKLKASRTSASTEDMIAEMVALGVSEDIARQAVANAKAKKAQEKAEKAKA